MSFLATGPIGSISSGYLGTSRLASHPLSAIQHHENGQSWSDETTLSPPHTHTTHTMINLTLSIAFPFWSIKVAVGTWRDCIIYFSNNFQNEWKLFVYCSSETKDGIMLTTPSTHLRYWYLKNSTSFLLIKENHYHTYLFLGCKMIDLTK